MKNGCNTQKLTGGTVRTRMRRRLLVWVGIFFLVGAGPAWGQWDNLLKSLKDSLGSTSVSESEIARGLKEALEVGSEHAVGRVSAVDGYYRNPDIRIPLPDDLKRIEELLRSVGLGKQMDAFVESMNRAAERAAPAARNIFFDAIEQMTIDDARRILNGRENEATRYFREKTGARLARVFEPDVHQAMAEVGVTRTWQDLEGRIRQVPFAGDQLRLDLDRYVTEKALDGLFVMLAEEERKIREDPAARVTALLKKVFE